MCVMMELSQKTIGDCLTWRAGQSPDKLAIEYHDKSYSWLQADRITDCLAVRLDGMGIRKGTHVGIWSVNTPNWVLYFLACAKLGAIPCLINTCYKAEELHNVIRSADIDVVCYGDGYKSLLYGPLIEQLRQNESCKHIRWIHIGRDERKRWLAEEFFTEQETGPEAMERLAGLRRQVMCDDIAAILFTSGTTHTAKGVLLSHYNLVNSALGTLDFTQWTDQDKLLLAVPLFHSFGITSGLLGSIHAGYPMHLIKYFKTIPVMEHVREYRCTVLNGVPSMFLALIHKPEFDHYDLSSLRSGIIAGSPVSENEYQDIIRRFPNLALLPSYGQTETSPCVTLMKPEDPAEKRASTAGRLIAYVQVRIMDLQTDEEQLPGETGEIQVRGYNVMQGYYKLPEETAKVMCPDGWLRTGDLGYMDPDGYLHVAGRIKEMIIRGGENISPLEIENCILDFPDVQDVKVLGIPAAVLQEKIVACVIPKPGCVVDAQQLRLYLTSRLAHYKVPGHILEFQEFPVTASGKVSISEITDQVINKVKQLDK